jgi:hypothetical protein
MIVWVIFWTISIGMEKKKVKEVQKTIFLFIASDNQVFQK